MIVNVTVTGDKAIMARLDRFPAAVHMALKIKITQLALRLERWVKTRKLNGQVLNRISGRLARSIANKVTDSQFLILARVYSSGDVKYAGIHEFGGRTAPHVIVPKRAKALFFGGQFAARVNHPGSQMPERSFLRSSLRDMSVAITTEMKRTVFQTATKAVNG